MARRRLLAVVAASVTSLAVFLALILGRDAESPTAPPPASRAASPNVTVSATAPTPSPAAPPVIPRDPSGSSTGDDGVDQTARWVLSSDRRTLKRQSATLQTAFEFPVPVREFRSAATRSPVLLDDGSVWWYPDNALEPRLLLAASARVEHLLNVGEDYVLATADGVVRWRVDGVTGRLDPVSPPTSNRTPIIGSTTPEPVPRGEPAQPEPDV